MGGSGDSRAEQKSLDNASTHAILGRDELNSPAKVPCTELRGVTYDPHALVESHVLAGDSKCERARWLALAHGGV